MSSSGLVFPLGSSARAAHETSYVPIPDDSRVTCPAPSMSEPSQCVFEVRVVAMRCLLRSSFDVGVCVPSLAES